MDRTGGPGPLYTIAEDTLARQKRILTPFGVDKQVGIVCITGHRVGGPMQPLQFAANPHAAFIKMTDRSRFKLVFNLLFDGH